MSSSPNPRDSAAHLHWEEVQTFEDLVAYVGPAPVGQLAGAEPPQIPSKFHRVARAMLGGLRGAGPPLSEERTRELAQQLVRLQAYAPRSRRDGQGS